jgi:hypothetical protein
MSAQSITLKYGRILLPEEITRTGKKQYGIDLDKQTTGNILSTCEMDGCNNRIRILRINLRNSTKIWIS